MSTYKVAVIPGDGIGPEVIQEGIKVLERVQTLQNIQFDCTEFEWGSAYYMEHGIMMPTDALDRLSSFDAICFPYRRRKSVTMGSIFPRRLVCRAVAPGVFCPGKTPGPISGIGWAAGLLRQIYCTTKQCLRAAAAHR